MNMWHVNIVGFAGDRLEGPLTTQQVKNMLDDNVINGKTQVLDPVETKNEWVKLQDTILGGYIVQREEENRQAKVAKKQSRNKNKQQVDVQIKLPQVPGDGEEVKASPIIRGIPSGPAELTRLERLPADALYYRGSVTCTQCNREIGNEILLNGESMTCGWCTCVNTVPLNPTNEGQKLLDGQKAIYSKYISASFNSKTRGRERETAKLIKSTASARRDLMYGVAILWAIGALVFFYSFFNWFFAM
jgi:hypothetical protein